MAQQVDHPLIGALALQAPKYLLVNVDTLQRITIGDLANLRLPEVNKIIKQHLDQPRAE